jgi:hypothetical protein
MGNTAESYRFFGHTMPNVDKHFRLPITVHIPGNLAEDEGIADATDGIVAKFSAPASGYVDMYDYYVGTKSGATDTVIHLKNSETARAATAILTLTAAAVGAFGTATTDLYLEKGDVVEVDVQSSHGTHAIDTTMIFHMRV